MTDDDLFSNMPEVLDRMFDHIEKVLKDLPE